MLIISSVQCALSAESGQSLVLSYFGLLCSNSSRQPAGREAQALQEQTEMIYEM